MKQVSSLIWREIGVLILPLLAINFIKVEEIDFFQLWGQIGTMYNNGTKWWLDRDNINDKVILDELEQLHNAHIKTTMIDDIVYEVVTKIEERRSHLILHLEIICNQFKLHFHQLRYYNILEYKNQIGQKSQNLKKKCLKLVMNLIKLIACVYLLIY